MSRLIRQMMMWVRLSVLLLSAVGVMALSGCGGSDETDGNNGSDGTDRSGGGSKEGLAAETTCPMVKAKIPPEAKFTTVEPEDGINVVAPGQNLTAKVVPLQATTAKSIENEGFKARAEKGVLLFVTFRFTNKGRDPVPSIQVAGLFRAQFGDSDSVYDQSGACRAGQIFTLNQELKLRQEVVPPGESAVGVAAYVVPRGGTFGWIGAGTGTKVILTSTDRS